jgi:hypothetical protein
MFPGAAWLLQNRGCRKTGGHRIKGVAASKKAKRPTQRLAPATPGQILWDAARGL